MKLETLKICNVCESANIFCIDRDYNIYRCRECGYIFNNPRPNAEEIAKFYSQSSKYNLWLDKEKAMDLLFLRRLKMIRKYKKTGTLLDIGAGTGQFLYFAKDNFDVKGTEISKSAVRIAKEKYDIDLLLGKIEDIDFGGLKFDVITLLHVLEHVPDPLLMIRKCRELLSKEGILVIAVPNDISSLKARIRRLLSLLKIGRFKYRGKFGLSKITLDGSQDEIHLSHFRAPVLKILFSKNNFTIVENGLDPYYTTNGSRKVVDDLFYLFCLLIKKVSGANIYDTIWVAVKTK